LHIIGILYLRQLEATQRKVKKKIVQVLVAMTVLLPQQHSEIEREIFANCGMLTKMGRLAAVSKRGVWTY
jgi:hypothetical protein